MIRNVKTGNCQRHLPVQIGDLSKIGLRHPQEFFFLYNLQKTDLRYLQPSGRNLKSKIGHIKKNLPIGLFASGGENNLLKGQFARILNFDQNTGKNAGFIKKVVFSIFRRAKFAL